MSLLGIDLGTERTRVWEKDRAVTFEIPTALAWDRMSKSYVHFGEQILSMKGKLPNYLQLKQPLRDGVVSDPEVCAIFLEFVLEQATGRALNRPIVYLSVPTGLSSIYRRLLSRMLEEAGARQVVLVSSVLCAARGIGLPTDKPKGLMILDLGAGCCDMGIVSLEGIVAHRTLFWGGQTLDRDIQEAIRRRHRVIVSEEAARKLRLSLSVLVQEGVTMEAEGVDEKFGFPKTIELTAEELQSALADRVTQIVSGVRHLLSLAPPEICHDLCHEGIWLAGGLAKTPGLARLLSSFFDLPVRVAQDPDGCPIRGIGSYVEAHRHTLRDELKGLVTRTRTHDLPSYLIQAGAR